MGGAEYERERKRNNKEGPLVGAGEDGFECITIFLDFRILWDARYHTDIRMVCESHKDNVPSEWWVRWGGMDARLNEASKSELGIPSLCWLSWHRSSIEMD